MLIQLMFGNVALSRELLPANIAREQLWDLLCSIVDSSVSHQIVIVSECLAT